MPDPTTPETATSQPASPAPAVVQTPAQDGADKPAVGADSGAEPSAKEVAEFTRHRIGLREKAKELQRGFAQMKEQRRAFEAEKKAMASEMADLRAEVKKWKEGNPLEHVEDPSKVVRDYVEKTGPERRIDQLEKALAERDARLAKLEKLPDEFEKKRAAELEQQRAQHEAAHQRAELQSFVRAIHEKATEYPYLYGEYEDAKIAERAAAIQQWARANNRLVKFEEAARFLDNEAKRVYESKSERRSKALPPEGLKPPSSTEHSGKKPPPGPGPRAERPPPATPPKGRRAQAAEDERYLEMIRNGQAKDRLAAEKVNGASKRS